MEAEIRRLGDELDQAGQEIRTLSREYKTLCDIRTDLDDKIEEYRRLLERAENRFVIGLVKLSGEFEKFQELHVHVQ